MKKSDIAMIILITSVSALVAFSIANSISFLKPSPSGVKVKTITSYTEDVGKPDPILFNGNAINPTVKTVVGN